MKFESIVEKHLNDPAIRSENPRESLTYDKLNCVANKIANLLVEKSIEKRDVVCISSKKDSFTISCIISCLKLGAVYVILDRRSPKKRIKKIINRCQPKMLICAEEDLIKFESSINKSKILVLPNMFSSSNYLLKDFSEKNLKITRKVNGDDPAYIMFTSGSTGSPKGALITHSNVLNFINWSVGRFKINKNDILTNLNPLFFDNSVFDIFNSLFSGSSILLITKNTLSNPIKLLSLIDSHKCTIWFSVPTLLIYLGTLKAFSRKNLNSIKKFIFGGEAYPLEKLIILFKTYNDKADFFNVYGPTECTCICSAHKITESDFSDMNGIPPLGKINENFNYQILDDENQLVKKGKVGELCLIGDNVGKGYYNDQKNTMKHFLLNPLNENFNEIMYKTGDLVVENIKNNFIYFKGRKDNQIKHMGYRIELEEIEYGLNSLSYIKQSAVFHKNINGISKIHAVVSSESNIKIKTITNDLTKIIPDYMLPGKYHFDNNFPTNRNGKVDKKLIYERHIASIK